MVPVTCTCYMYLVSGIVLLSFLYFKIIGKKKFENKQDEINRK